MKSIPQEPTLPHLARTPVPLHSCPTEPLLPVLTQVPISSSSPPLSPTSGLLLMLLGSALFAGMGVTIAKAHASDPSLSVLVSGAVRAGVNMVALLIMAGGRPSLLLGDMRPALWLRGVAGGGALLCYFGCLSFVGPGTASFLNQTSAVWVALLGPLFLKERTHPLVGGAVLGSIVGISLLVDFSKAAGGMTGWGLGLISGLLGATAYLSIRKASRTNSPLTVVFYFTVVGTILAVGLALFRGVSWPKDPVILSLLITAGLLATLAQLAMTEAYRRAPAARVAAVGAAGPLLTTFLEWGVLGTIPSGRAGWGMGILLMTAVALPLLMALGLEKRDKDLPIDPPSASQ